MTAQSTEPEPAAKMIASDATVTLVAQRWCRASSNVSGPIPPAAALNAMLDQIGKACLRLQAQPLDLRCESWQRPEGIAPEQGNDFLARIAVTVRSGLGTESLRCWFQWQHPHWIWSTAPFPVPAAIEGNTA